MSVQQQLLPRVETKVRIISTISSYSIIKFDVDTVCSGWLIWLPYVLFHCHKMESC